MGRKNLKHKESNDFRFKSFANRVNDIDIRKTALYHIGHNNEDLPEIDECYFHQTIRKWSVLNLTEEYNEFAKKCQDIVTLPQLIYKKDIVVNLMLEKFETATTLSLQPLLELLVVLAKDLREEFYPYFGKVLQKLIFLLQSLDADQLEWTLICLAFLFKTLKPFLKRDISVIFSTVLPLLDDTKYAGHVTNFAAECFSFVARDIRDQEAMLSLVLRDVNQYQDGVQGCGHLFFEIIRSVNGNFHSIAETFLEIFFCGLFNEKYDQDLLFKILTQTVEDILEHIHPHNMERFWLVIGKVTKKYIENCTINESAVHKLLILITQTVEWKNGRFLNEIESIVNVIFKVIDSTDNQEILITVSKLICNLLNSNYIKVTQLDTSRLVKKMLNVSHKNVFEHFIWNISTHSQFEILILPEFLKYFENDFNKDTLNLITKIICSKSQFCHHGIQLEDWKKYPILLKNNDIYEEIIKLIQNLTEDNFEMHIQAVILYPHLVGYDSSKICELLENQMIETIENNINMEDEKLFILLSTTLESYIHLSKNLNKKIYQNIIKFLLPHCNTNMICLETIDLLLTYANQYSCLEILYEENFNDIHSIFSNNLYSSNHQVRLISSHTLKLFYKYHKSEIFNIFYQIECIQPNVQTYRDQILLLQKLSPEGEIFRTTKSIDIRLDCLKYILGLLYYNFKLIWDPILKMIEEYFLNFNNQEFWDIFKLKLEETAEFIINNETKPIQIQQFNFNSDSLKEIFSYNYENKSDYYNYRNLLWKCIPNLGAISEIKNREIVILFLDFIKNEYKKSQDLLNPRTFNMISNDSINFENDSDNDEEIELLPKKYKKKSKSQKQNLTATLIVKLEIFTKMTNPSQLYRESELYSFYLELLSNRNPILQKLALDCILAYKKKYLTSYKENLYSIIDEKKFKDELINFKINGENTTVLAEHRKEFLPILLRILYGKMTTKGSNKMISSQVRKSIIMRFLGQCENEEIFDFLKMIFSYYQNILKENLENIPKKISFEFTSNSNENLISPKRLQSSINILELIRKQFGGLMQDECIQYILKIIILAGSVSNEVLKNPRKIHTNFIKMYKNLRAQSLLCLVNFFEHYRNFIWLPNSIQTIFDIFVTPLIEKLPSDSIHTPTPLLKLFLIWCNNPKHFSFFIKTYSSITPIESIIQLLLTDKAKPIIRQTIMEMFEILLITQQDDDDTNQQITGLSIIIPYIPKILEYFQIKIKKKGIKFGLDKRDLFILSKLTDLVTDPLACSNLLDLILPVLMNKLNSSGGEELIIQVIKTISNLIKKIDKPEKHIRKIAPLFEQIIEVDSRKMLCTLLYDIAETSKERQPNLIQISKVIQQLNAWDRRWIEQPDYDKRFEGLKSLKIYLDNDEIDIDFSLFIIYNCFHFIKNDKDMGIRDSSSEFLRELIPKLIHKYHDNKKELDYLINDIILNIIRRLIRNTTDTIRNEGINLLGEIVRECSDSNMILKDLYPLCNKDNREQDFFDNITNLQYHYHSKALLKFCSCAKTFQQIPNPKTLTQFILPFATKYLMHDKFQGHHTLIDSAIETIGYVCQLLPWYQYRTVLTHYIQNMKYHREYQKQSVRIVVSILDAFHFDLTLDKKDTNLKNEIIIEQKQQSVESKLIEDNNNTNDLDLDMKLDELVETDENLKPLLAIEKTTTLSPSATKRVLHDIVKILIPTLNNSITELSNYESKHKLNRRKAGYQREEEEILRVPIALALTKLLQKLPKEILDTSLPGVFMKVCTFLKSPIKSVRMLTRDILKKIMLNLDTSYLSMLVEQLTTLLTRGFQVHVLSVTMHGVLDTLKDKLKSDDIECCLQNILQVCLNDIFGEASFEKDINKIAIHTPEARSSTKSFLTLYIIAKNITESCLLDLLVPFKNYLSSTQSKKVVTKVQECFQKIISGLTENQNVSIESLLIFVYGITNEKISDLFPDTKQNKISSTDGGGGGKKGKQERPDCFIIKNVPRTYSGVLQKNLKNSKANAHVLIEFGLGLLHFILKRKKLNDIDYQSFLNPLVQILNDSLKSSNIRITTFTLKCLSSIWNAEYDLPALKDSIQMIVDQMFLLLHQYSTFGTTKKDDNFHLMKSVLKSFISLLRKCEYYNVSNENMVKLILYVEQDLHESDKQPMAFSLLKAIVFRKVLIPEIHDIVKKLCELAIISESEHSKEEARSIILFYIMEYPVRKKIESLMNFFLTQLNYEVTTGRLSAIRFIQSIIRKFPGPELNKKSEVLFLALGTRLVNENVPECRIIVAECIELLIAKIDENSWKQLFEMTILFLDGDKPAVREMGAILCSRFISFKKEEFYPFTEKVLPILVSRLSLSNPNAPGRFVKVESNDFAELNNNDNDDDDDDDNKLKQDQITKSIDHEFIQIQNCILKIIEICPQVLSDKVLLGTIDELAYESQKLLGYDHVWVRMNAIKILQNIIASYDFALVQKILNLPNSSSVEQIFIYQDPHQDLKSLTLDLCAQMQPGETSEEMAEEISKILLYIANMLKSVDLNTKSKDDIQGMISLQWLIRRIRYIIHGEVAKTSQSCILRTALFNWVDGLITLIDSEMLLNISHGLLTPLIREMSDSDKNINANLRQKAISVSNKIRKKLGDDIFNKLRVELNNRLLIRRNEKRKQVAQEKVNDPVKAAKRKRGVQERKKEAKKRKSDTIRGKVTNKKKRKNFEIDDF